MFQALLNLFRPTADKNVTRRQWWLAHWKAAHRRVNVECHGHTVTPEKGDEMVKFVQKFRADYPNIRRYDEPTADELKAMGS